MVPQVFENILLRGTMLVYQEEDIVATFVKSSIALDDMNYWHKYVSVARRIPIYAGGCRRSEYVLVGWIKPNESNIHMILTLGSLLGLFSVGFGAFSEHILRMEVTEEQFRFLGTALRYNQVNAVAAVAIGFALLSSARVDTRALRWSGQLFIVSTILFSFSIYTSVATGLEAILYATPIGGIVNMVAWAMLAKTGFSALKRPVVSELSNEKT